LAFFKRLFTWWNGSTLGTSLQIRTKAEKVGEDEFGNQYFESEKLRYDGRTRRYVIYSDYAEASKVPGTPFAYKPKGSLDRGGVREPVAADYEAWTPGN